MKQYHNLSFFSPTTHRLQLKTIFGTRLPQWIFVFLILIMNTACNIQLNQTEESSKSFKLFGDIGSESSYCGSVTNPSPATTVTSTAQFMYRPSTVGGLQAPTTAPIRYAEAAILNSSGSIVNCGSTDETGSITINIPRTAGTYTLKVYSRADNNFFKASVLNDPTHMSPYSISASFSISGSDTSKAVTLTPANYTSTLEGGAFNILDQIYKANDFIRNNSTCSSLGNICSAFTIAPKVRIFWIPGMSPGSYYEQDTAAISFFIAQDEPAFGMATGIYILGGVGGSVCADTDHFDNSVIVHEYGHFLESAFAHSESPGGSHNGNAEIDPRLAWSEGWSNFFQAAVSGNSRYIDTIGSPGCSTGSGTSVILNLETKISGQDYVDSNSFLGEGIFREVSVSRSLWDSMTSSTGGDNQGANLGFSYIWKAFSDSTSGFRNSNFHFRNMGKFNEILRSYITSNLDSSYLTAFDNLVSNEYQRSDQREYGYILTSQSTSSGGTCSFETNGNPQNPKDSYSRSNDFFAYYYDGQTRHNSITLKYSKVSTEASFRPSDLDIYLWTQDYVLGDPTTLISAGEKIYPENGTSGIESISFSGRAAGWYMIQIKVDPENVFGKANYYLETNGGTERLCP